MSRVFYSSERRRGEDSLLSYEDKSISKIVNIGMIMRVYILSVG